MKSRATTVEEYLAELPDDRRKVISHVRSAILKVLPKGYEEAMNWSVICYQVPLDTYPDTYNKQPLMFAGLASQKNYMVMYLMGASSMSLGEDWLRQQFEKAGKKLNMKGSCLRFTRLDDLALEPILEMISKANMESYIEYFKSNRPAKG